LVCDTDRGSVFVFDESKPEVSFAINLLLKNFQKYKNQGTKWSGSDSNIYNQLNLSRGHA